MPLSRRMPAEVLHSDILLHGHCQWPTEHLTASHCCYVDCQPPPSMVNWVITQHAHRAAGSNCITRLRGKIFPSATRWLSCIAVASGLSLLAIPISQSATTVQQPPPLPDFSCCELRKWPHCLLSLASPSPLLRCVPCSLQRHGVDAYHSLRHSRAAQCSQQAQAR